MDLIDDIDLVFSLIWFEFGSFDQIADIFDSVIARSIDFDDIEHGFVIESLTIHTLMARISIFWIRTIEGFREYSSARCFPSST